MWRGLACLLVVCFHSSFYVATPVLHTKVVESPLSASVWDLALVAIARCWIGVPIFFVISGYCIAATADSQRLRGRPAATYFCRRFRRIFPPYWACVALAVLVVGAVGMLGAPGLFSDADHEVPSPTSLGLSQWIGNLALIETWRNAAFGGERKLFLDHAWTLCYEEQFYLVVGLFLLLPRRWFFHLLALTSALVFLNAVNLNIRPVRMLGIDLNAWKLHCEGAFFDGRWLEFAAGLLLYYQVNYATRSQAWCISGLYVLGIVWAAWEPARLGEFYANSAQFRLTAFVAGLTLACLHPWDKAIATAAIGRALAWCGRMCYSFYLVHWPVTKATSHLLFSCGLTSPSSTLCITIPVGVLASVLVAWPFHVLVERQFLNTRTSETVVKVAVAQTV